MLEVHLGRSKFFFSLTGTFPYLGAILGAGIGWALMPQLVKNGLEEAKYIAPVIGAGALFVLAYFYDSWCGPRSDL